MLQGRAVTTSMGGSGVCGPAAAAQPFSARERRAPRPTPSVLPRSRPRARGGRTAARRSPRGRRRGRAPSLCRRRRRGGPSSTTRRRRRGPQDILRDDCVRPWWRRTPRFHGFFRLFRPINVLLLVRFMDFSRIQFPRRILVVILLTM